MQRLFRRRTFSSSPRPLVSVLTPTIPGREEFLAENMASVQAQTLHDHEHLILLDADYAGCGATMNALAAKAKGEWLFLLADDDLAFPRCLEHHVEGADSEIVYGPPLVWGEDAAQFRADPPGIPSTALISAKLWRKLGGYDESLPRAEDGDFWRRAERRGAVFTRIEQPTWLYRFHGANKSRS